ncbi:MAG TPA: glycosyltransferase, partial [Acetobacteraceae bacterium]
MTDLADQLRPLFDAAFYLAKYPDLTAARVEPLDHYTHVGLQEGRDPNPFFDSTWYRDHNPDVAASDMDPLLHYLTAGAAELRNPHPHFDAPFYVEHHPQAAANPLMFHMLTGRARGFPTEPAFDAAAFLPSDARAPACPAGLRVDIVIPCYRGLAETRRCIASVLADSDRPTGRVIVIDDASPQPALSKFLATLAADTRVKLLRNAKNLGFVATANRGIAEAGRSDVVLLNADTEVPQGWLSRLAGHAYAQEGIASVSPWSNDATICSYPTVGGGPPAFDLAAIDAAARAVNAGRRVRVPTTVGFCMYIRRAALDDVGLFDAEAFGRGYGEEVDFCLRAAARGWRHMLACDTYVHHAAEISFGAGATAARAAGEAALALRWPDFARTVERHVRRGAAEPARFALTAELFRRAKLPVILCVSHRQGGGVDRHVEHLAETLRGRANLLLLQPCERGVMLTAPGLPGHGAATVPAERTADLVRILASVGVSRVHVHHIMGLDDLDLRALISGLGVPFDVTVHDWFLLCPPVNLLPHLDGEYCGEPDQGACNLCIAERPSHGAREILHWRARHAWLPREAERVLCPSEDTRQRVIRHGWGARAILAPHEPASAKPWTLRPVAPRRDEPLRVAMLGVLAGQKGAASVLALAEATEAAEIELRLIGYPEQPLSPHLRRRIKVTGPYKDAALPSLLAKARPHVAWFPAQWPETWSFTLSAAIDAGLPIIASRIGAFPERLAGRPLTWLVDPAATTAEWRAAFAKAREALRARKPIARSMRPAVADFYATAYLTTPPPTPSRKGRGDSPTQSPLPLREGVRGRGTARPRVRVIVIPERFPTGVPTPCAYIRLLQPLHHLAADLDVVVATLEEALRLRADIVVTHRHAIPDLAASDSLVAHCRAAGMKLVYDLDDDLARIPSDHADAALLRPKAAVVRRLLADADAVWISTKALAPLRGDARVVPNGLDEHLWLPDGATLPSRRPGPVRILFMGTTTHGEDFALVRPALTRLHTVFGGRVRFDMIGVTQEDDLPSWVNRSLPGGVAGQSYPGFVNWITRMPAWDIGIA